MVIMRERIFNDLCGLFLVPLFCLNILRPFLIGPVLWKNLRIIKRELMFSSQKQFYLYYSKIGRKEILFFVWAITGKE